MAPIALASAQINLSTKPLWDPWKILDVYPSDPDFSCVGIAKSHGGRCGWQFWYGKWTPAEADLALMSTMHPSQVSDSILSRLARHSLCSDWHADQAYDKVQEWRAKINHYQQTSSAQPALLSALQKAKVEPEERKNNLPTESEIASLRGKVVESAATIRTLQESQTARSSEITSLTEKQKASSLSVSLLKDIEIAQTKMIKGLREECNIEGDRTKRANDLYEEVKASASRLEEERDAKVEEVSSLKQDVWNLEAELEENERTQRSKSRETDNLRQQLNASNALIEDLRKSEVITALQLNARNTLIEDLRKDKADSALQLNTSNALIEDLQRDKADSALQLNISNDLIEDLGRDKVDTALLHQKLEDANRNLAESDNRISQLQQENQKVKTQKHFIAFHHHIKSSVKQKQYERARRANQALIQQSARLTDRLEEADMQLAAQDRTLSFFKLKDVTKGLCAVVSLKPHRLSIRRFSKMGGLVDGEAALEEGRDSRSSR